MRYKLYHLTAPFQVLNSLDMTGLVSVVTGFIKILRGPSLIQLRAICISLRFTLNHIRSCHFGLHGTASFQPHRFSFSTLVRLLRFLALGFDAQIILSHVFRTSPDQNHCLTGAPNACYKSPRTSPPGALISFLSLILWLELPKPRRARSDS
jgi:hypothetical protein